MWPKTREYGKVVCSECGNIVKDTAIDEYGQCPSCRRDDDRDNEQPQEEEEEEEGE